jgi:hydroxymethylpyrimidine/phosphomethylpyrimidine kinase
VTSALPIALTVAGSDGTGGAGIQGDLRTFAAHGVHGLSAITCVTVQGTRGVRSVVPLAASLVRAQIDAALEDLYAPGARVAKLGALATAEIVAAIADALDARPELAVVADTVIASSSGARLLDDAGVALLAARIFPRATLITPNAEELRILAELAEPVRDEAGLLAGARVLLERGARAVLAKGGHLPGAPVDLLVTRGTREAVVRLPGERLTSDCTHGTGCTLASAIAAHLAHGRSLEEAARRAKRYVSEAIAAATPIGHGKSPLAHFAPRDP